MSVSAKFIYGSPYRNDQMQLTLEKVLWEIASDLDNVPIWEAGKDNRHVVDKTNMTVLLICSSISGNGHGACLSEQARRACSVSMALQEWEAQCREGSRLYLCSTWQQCHCLQFRAFLYPRASWLVFAGYVIYHFNMCFYFTKTFAASLSFVFPYTFQTKD